jgi:hypothetical protein
MIVVEVAGQGAGYCGTFSGRSYSRVFAVGVHAAILPEQEGERNVR